MNKGSHFFCFAKLRYFCPFRFAGVVFVGHMPSFPRQRPFRKTTNIKEPNVFYQTVIIKMPPNRKYGTLMDGFKVLLCFGKICEDLAILFFVFLGRF